jgi:hypothetical protein
MRHEAGDVCKFPATFERLYECGCRRRAPGLVYVACIFTRRRGNIHVGRNDSGKQFGLVIVFRQWQCGQRGIIHNPVRVHLLLQRNTLLQYMIVRPILVKTSLQPALHRVTTEMREWEARLGMIWVCCTEAGRAGISRVLVCMECTCLPLGSRAMMGLLVRRMLVLGAAVVRK